MSDLRQRAPRARDNNYMGWIAALPCLAYMAWSGRIVRGVQVAHLRAGSLEHGKPHTGMAEKPGDRWTLPLSQEWHTGDKRKAPFCQHEMDEVEFWTKLGIDPFAVCLALGSAHDVGRSGMAVLSRHAGEAFRNKTL